jgi:Flp pilus assembly protein TadG
VRDHVFPAIPHKSPNNFGRPPAKMRRGGGCRWRRGTALVEMALVGILLLTLTFAAVEYGWMFLKQQQVVNAARQAARLAANIDSSNGQLTSQITTQMTSYGISSGAYTTTIYVDGAAGGDVSAAGRGHTVGVKIAVTYGTVSVTHLTSLLALPVTLSATVTMEKEGI